MANMSTFLLILSLVLQFISSSAEAPLNPDQVEADIVGGKEAQEGEWPWQVFIEQEDITYGGVLVHPQWVLTWRNQLNPTGSASVSMGSNNIDSPWSNLQKRTVIQSLTHPSRSGDNYRISLLKLNSPFYLNDYVRTVCLSDPTTMYDAFPSGTPCIAAGWGSTSESDTGYSTKLLELQVEVEQRDYCRTQYPDHTITDQMICVGGAAGKGSCKGDGPLVSKVSSRWYVVGVPNFSNGCGMEDYAAVFTYVNHPAIYSWIKSVIDPSGGGSASIVVSSTLVIVTSVLMSIVL